MLRSAGQNEKEIFSKNSYQAIEQIMSLYGTMVLRTAYFYTGDRYLAEDISQEVFLRAYQNWSKFRGDSKVKTWLTSITVNLCRDKLALKMSSEQPTDPNLLNLNQSISVEEEAIERLSKSELLQSVLRLPKPYQEILYLYYYLELSTREIAESIAIPEGTARGRLHRARELLAKELKKEEMDYERA